MLTRAELSRDIARRLEIPASKAELILETIIELMAGSLNRGDEIEIRGFGSFRIHQREARLGRNPRSGEPISVPARKVVRFKPAKRLALRLIEGKRPGIGMKAPLTARARSETSPSHGVA